MAQPISNPGLATVPIRQRSLSRPHCMLNDIKTQPQIPHAVSPSSVIILKIASSAARDIRAKAGDHLGGQLRTTWLLICARSTFPFGVKVAIVLLGFQITVRVRMAQGQSARFISVCSVQTIHQEIPRSSLPNRSRQLTHQLAQSKSRSSSGMRVSP